MIHIKNVSFKYSEGEEYQLKSSYKVWRMCFTMWEKWMR